MATSTPTFYEQAFAASASRRRPGPESTAGVAEKRTRLRVLRADEEILLGMQIQDAARLRRIARDFMAENGREAGWQEWAAAAGIDGETLEARLGAGDAAKNAMVVSNLGLARHVVGAYLASSRGRSGDHSTCRFVPQDLIQEATLGLIRAAEKFDPARGVRFASYASWWIRSALTKTLQQQQRIIRVPQVVAEELSRCRRVRAELTETLRRPPTDVEVAAAAGVPLEKLEMYQSLSSGVLSLDARTGSGSNGGSSGGGGSAGRGSGGAGRGGASGSGDGGGFSLADATLADADPLAGGGGGRGDLGWAEALRDDLNTVLERCLLPTERELIRLKYGLDDGQPRTAAECAEALGLRKEEAQAAARAALAKLRKSYRVGEHLAGYLHA